MELLVVLTPIERYARFGSASLMVQGDGGTGSLRVVPIVTRRMATTLMYHMNKSHQLIES